MKKENMAAAEAIMMGFGHFITTEDHAVASKDVFEIVQYIIATHYLADFPDKFFQERIEMAENTAKEVISNFFYTSQRWRFPIAISVSNTDFGTLINIPVRTEYDVGKTAKELVLSDEGCYGYCHNIDYPDCSEWGTSLYKVKQGRVVRTA